MSGVISLYRSEMGMYTYQIEYISETPGVSPKLNFRKQMNILFKAYMMGYAAVLLNLAYQQFRVNPKGVKLNVMSIFEKKCPFLCVCWRQRHPSRNKVPIQVQSVQI